MTPEETIREVTRWLHVRIYLGIAKRSLYRARSVVVNSIDEPFVNNHFASAKYSCDAIERECDARLVEIGHESTP